MANTPNINLVKPLGTDRALVSVINDNSDKIDAFAGSTNTNMANTQAGYAIVVDGNNAPKAITAGQYLFIKNHSTLSAGGYHATANIANGAAITSSNVAADADGVVNGAFSALNSKIAIETYSASDVITAGTNVTVNDQTYAYKTGNMVELCLNVMVSASVSSLGMLKTAVRPKHSFQVVGLNNNDDKAEGNFGIGNNGGLSCYGLTANKQYIIHATYVCE